MAERIRIPSTPEEHAALMRESVDLVRFAGVNVLISADPDHPDRMRSCVHVDPRKAPCYFAIAQELVELAERFAELHDEQSCEKRWAT